jgi:hypothetical protein
MTTVEQEPANSSHKLLLNQHVASYFARDQYVLRPVHRMQNAGIFTIGQLISVPEQTLFSRFKVSKRSQTELKTLISNWGLSFASDQPKVG